MGSFPAIRHSLCQRCCSRGLQAKTEYLCTPSSPGYVAESGTPPPPPTHTHECKTNGHNSGSECQNPRQLDRQTRQSMSGTNRRLSAAQVTGREGYASWGMHRDLLPLAASLDQKPVQDTAKCQILPGCLDTLGESGPAPTQLLRQAHRGCG